MLEKVNFGIIGTSLITEKFLDAAKDIPEFNLKGVYSRSMEKAKRFGEKYGAELFFDDVDVMASSKEIQAVYIASPTAFHARHTLQCLRHKKHVLCEKPFASNYHEVETMIKTAKENNVVLMEAMKTTHTPNYKWIKAHLEEIGPIRRYFGNFCKRSSRYENYKNGIIENAFKPELSNGSVMDIGVYCIYPMVDLFGLPNSITAQALFLNTGVDGSGTIMAEYNHMEGVIHHSKMVDSYGPSEIQGELGSVFIGSMDFFSDVRIRFLDGRTIEPPHVQKNDVMYYEIVEMISLIKSNKLESDINTYLNSLNTMKLLDESRRQIGLKYPVDYFC